jgi:hypothetical protein
VRSDGSEAAFMKAAGEALQDASLMANTRFHVIYQLFMPAIDLLLFGEEVFLRFLAVHLLALALIAVIFITRPKGVPLALLSLVLNIGQVAAINWIVAAGITSTGRFAPHDSLALTFVAAVALTLAPANWWAQALSAAVSFGAGYLTLGGQKGADAWLVTEALSLGATSLIIHQAVLIRARNVRANNRRLIRVAPGAIVRRAVLEQASLETVFAPAARRCVCISLGWNDFDQLATTGAPEETVKALNLFYQVAHATLVERLGDASVFLETTADELFAVIFAAPDTPLDDAWRAALLAVEGFARKWAEVGPNATAARLNAGLAVGIAWVGLMGPSSHRKTTALGEVPGRAARLRAIAKRATLTRGDGDRIAVDPAQLPTGYGGCDGWSTVAMDPSLTVKDLELDAVTFFETSTDTPAKKLLQEAAA